MKKLKELSEKSGLNIKSILRCKVSIVKLNRIEWNIRFKYKVKVKVQYT